MVGPGGTLSIKTHKRKFKAPATTSKVVEEGVEEAAGAGPGDIEAAAAFMSPAAASMSPSLVRAWATPAPAPAAEDDGRASTPPAKAALPPGRLPPRRLRLRLRRPREGEGGGEDHQALDKTTCA